MKILFILFLFSYTCKCFGQTCIHDDISNHYNFKTNISRYKLAGTQDSCIIKITIIKKEDGKPIQTIKITSNYLFDSTYFDCNAKRSYMTLKNVKAVAQDNDFGDIIIADFNFDTLEDIALKNSSGGNGGPTYNYYLQNGVGKFVLDNYLSNTMEFFPLFINKKKENINHAGSC